MAGCVLSCVSQCGGESMSKPKQYNRVDWGFDRSAIEQFENRIDSIVFGFMSVAVIGGMVAIFAIAVARADTLTKQAQPPYGLMAPCETCAPHDGDTVAITLPGGTRIWRIRLDGIKAPELNEPGGKESRDWLIDYLDGKEIGVFIAWPSDRKKNLLDYPTFNRLPGTLWADGENINTAIVAAGHATKTKRK